MVSHLLLQLENAVHQCLGCWWAAWHVDINRHNSVATSDNRVGVMVVATTVGAGTHGDNPSWLGHLVVNLSKGRGHLICQCTRHNHNIGLTWRRSENDTQSILIVSRRRDVHHLDGTARQTERHRPERALSCPVSNSIQTGESIVHGVDRLLFRRQWIVRGHLAPQTLI